jgi:DNA-binding response OmpR family regulator
MTPAMSEPAPSAAPPKRILVIDDVAELRELAQSVLQDAGYVVEVAQDTTLGALKLMARKPDLMILDLNMPGVDGFTFIEHIKEVTTPPPIVFLSGSRNLETVLRGVALGVFAFLPKPVNFTALLETCRAALAKAGAQVPPQVAERRAHKRHSLLVQVRLSRDDKSTATARDLGETPKAFVLGELRELSAGGARIICVSKLPVGSRVEIMPDPKVVHTTANLVAEIRSSEEIDTGFRHGLAFVDLDPETEKLLKENLSSGAE